MRLFVTVKPNAKVPSFQKIDGTHFLISVKEPPHQGKANEAVIKALAVHCKISVSKIRLAKGHASRNKILVVSE